MPLDLIKSEKNKDLLVYNGFIFRKERISVNKAIWRCIEHSKAGCRGRCHTEDGEVIMHNDEHNHVPDAAKLSARRIIQNVKDKAVNTQLSTNNIIAQSSIGVSQATAVQLPSTSSIARTIQRKRQTTSQAPSIPSNLAELIIPDLYSKTKTGEDFLLFDSGPSVDRILIFSTRKNLQLLAQCRNWFSDGTFKVVPPLFDQLYTIHAIQHNKVTPFVFILMPNRRESSYERVFEALKNLEPSLNPDSIMTDFERAAMNAFNSSFPSSNQRGCFFHFSQCIWRKIQSSECHEIQKRYNDDPDFALQIKMLAALAFVPPNDVIRVFDDLVESEFFDCNQRILKPLIDYFLDNWIGMLQTRRRRRDPTFAITLWNCYYAVIDGLPKTNNALEGWHRAFSSLLSAHHPTIWKFINAIQQEQSLNELKLNQYSAGVSPPKSRRKYRDSAKNIMKIVEEYDQRDPIEYLSSIANHLNFNV